MTSPGVFQPLVNTIAGLFGLPLLRYATTLASPARASTCSCEIYKEGTIRETTETQSLVLGEATQYSFQFYLSFQRGSTLLKTIRPAVRKHLLSEV